MFGNLPPLNDAQLDAVTHGDGPLLVVAGAGSGKTLTLACRVAHLVQEGVPAERLLLLTFTRRVAREMLSRAQRICGHDGMARAWGGTFHAVGNRLLRRFGRSLGLRPDFTVMDQADAADLMNLIRGELGLGAGRNRFPRKDALAAIYSRTVNAGARLTEILRRDFPWCAEGHEGIREIFRRYTVRKKEQNVVDYDDLLLYWKALSRDSTGAGAEAAALFDHLLVDEYQDTNALQADILLGMRSANRNLTVVGDDAQAIYSFRSATNRNILEFPQVFPDARVVKLEQNYRSTRPILRASNAVIALTPERHDKTLWSDRHSDRPPMLLTCLDEADQCDAVCRHLLEHREQGVPLKEQAVLFRAAHHSDRLEVELTRRNIPFVKYGGLKFMETAHVKDMLAVLRILENPHDEVGWFRVLQLLDGVGPAAARRLMDAIGVRREWGREDQGSPLRRLIDTPDVGAPGSASVEFAELRSALADCAPDGEPAPPAAQIERIRRFLEPVVVRLYTSPRERLRDIEQLELIASGYASRGRFLAELTLDPPSSTSDLAGPPLVDEDFVILSTIHSAKGCEWDVVHVIHAADGMIPSDMATGRAEEIEEERRLFYVALTRARDMLYVYFPLRYYRRKWAVGDLHSYAQVTRFLPPPVREHFDQQSTVTDTTGDEPLAVAAGGATREVETFLEGLWNE